MILLRPRLAQNPRLVAGFTTRAFAHKEESLDEIRARLGASEKMHAVASVGQVHGAAVVTVREGQHVADHDGLVTDTPGVLLTVISADCALILFADAEARVVGACHSGWRGTVAGIAGETVRAMERLGARPDRIAAYVGPCISAEAFEVGDEVAAQFPDASVVRRAEWPRPHVDLGTDLERQLAEVGIQDIEVAGGCTVRDVDRYYSYRAENGKTGRMIGFVGLRDGDA